MRHYDTKKEAIQDVSLPYEEDFSLPLGGKAGWMRTSKKEIVEHRVRGYDEYSLEAKMLYGSKEPIEGLEERYEDYKKDVIEKNEARKLEFLKTYPIYDL